MGRSGTETVGSGSRSPNGQKSAVGRSSARLTRTAKVQGGRASAGIGVPPRNKSISTRLALLWRMADRLARY